jgi:hypothetical protein
MKAAGQSGIPCSFVIGKDGKVAFIGHPLFLDEVLPKVLAGTWDAAAGAAELKAADAEWDRVYAAIQQPKNPAEQLATWEAFAKKWPTLANDPYMTGARLRLLVAAKRTADAKALAAGMVAKAGKRADTSALSTVSAALRADAAKGQPELLAMAVTAAEAVVAAEGESNTAALQGLVEAHAAAGNAAKVAELAPKLVAAVEAAVKDDKDTMGQLRLAAAYSAAGQKDKAKAAAEKAVASVDASNRGLKQYVAEQAKTYGVEPPAADKK